MMDSGKIIKSSQDQAVASWVSWLNHLRFNELSERLSGQDVNFEAAMTELRKLDEFIADPAHILGNELTKHGEIAEHVQVRFSNADKLIAGLAPTHTFDGVARTAMEDYIRNGHMVQSKFYMGPSGTLTAIGTHLEMYPDFVKEGGVYDIPLSQHGELTRIYENGLNGTPETPSDQKLFEAIREWEQSNDLSFPDVVKPSVVDYDDVQIDSVGRTIEAKKAYLAGKDKALREGAQAELAPSVAEGAKVAAVSALFESGFSFASAVHKKRTAGKGVSDFDASDWAEVGMESGVGALKGGLRGSSVYALTNLVAMPAPVATSLFTATLGVSAEAIRLARGESTAREFAESSEDLCLGVAVSALSSILGEALIPVPVLGAVIGNMAGMYACEIGKAYLGEFEQAILESYFEEAEARRARLATEYACVIEEIESRAERFDCLIAMSFDEDVNARFEASVEMARLVGVEETDVLVNADDAIDYFC